MDTVLDTLYRYAAEHRMDAFLEADRTELADTRAMVEHALAALARTGGAQGADLAGRLEFGQGVLLDIHCRAGFLAGLSMGLELSRL